MCVQVKLSRLCEQDKTLKELEGRISVLKDDKVRPYTHFMLLYRFTSAGPGRSYINEYIHGHQ